MGGSIEDHKKYIWSAEERRRIAKLHESICEELLVTPIEKPEPHYRTLERKKHGFNRGRH